MWRIVNSCAAASAMTYSSNQYVMVQVTVVRGSIFSNSAQPNRTPYNQQQTFGHKEDNLNISQSVKVYQVLLIYQYFSLSAYQVLLQQSQEAYQVL